MAAQITQGASSQTERCRIFVSATSTDLRSARLMVCEVLNDKGHEARFQERFDHGYRSLEDFLKDRISECQAVVCLAGRAFGAAPDDTDAARRSYTQLEYDVARELGLPVFVFIAGDVFAADADAAESSELAGLQQAHLESLRRSHKWSEFATVSELRGQVEALADQLPRVLPLVMLEQHRPPPPAYFAGRVRELEQLASAARLRTPSLIAVVGMGGQGKTTLVDRWVREQPRIDWQRGMWISLDRAAVSFDQFLDLALTFLLGDTYDKRQMPESADRTDALLGALRSQPVLFVLDGLERWLKGWTIRPEEAGESADTVDARSGQTDLVDEFLRQAAALSNGTHILFTARALPAALDDIACTIIPVRDETDLETALDGLEPAAAVKLLERLGVSGTEEELRALAETYQAHPLALTVLAGLLRKLYGGRIEHLPQVSPLDPRRSLHAVLESTLRHLPSAPQAEKLLAVAALALEDPPLMALAAAMPGEPNELRDLAVTLADWSVIRWDGARQIVQMHPLVRQFAAQRIADEDAREIHERYSVWYEALSLPSSPRSLEQIAPRLLAIEHSLRAGTPVRCIELLFAPVLADEHLVEWAQACGHHSTLIDVLGRVAGACPPEQRPALLAPRAALERQLGRLAEALTDLDAALDILGSVEPDAPATYAVDAAGASINRGNVLRQLARPAEALQSFDAALDFLRRLPAGHAIRVRHVPGTLMNRGLVLRETGNFTEAAEACWQAMDGYRESVREGHDGLEAHLAQAIANYAIVLTELGRSDEALPFFDEALALHALHALDAGQDSELHVREAAQVRISKAAALTESGAAVEAAALLDELVEELQRLVDAGRADLSDQLALAVVGRAYAYLGTRDWPAAAADCRRAQHLLEDLIGEGRVDLHSWLAFGLLNEAEALHESGANEESASARERGLELLEKRIVAGEPETRVIYLRKSAVAARYLADRAPEEGRAILERAVRELETALGAGETVEALRLEARRAVRELDAVPANLYGPLLARVMRSAL